MHILFPVVLQKRPVLQPWSARRQAAAAQIIVGDTTMTAAASRSESFLFYFCSGKFSTQMAGTSQTVILVDILVVQRRYMPAKLTHAAALMPIKIIELNCYYFKPVAAGMQVTRLRVRWVLLAACCVYTYCTPS